MPMYTDFSSLLAGATLLSGLILGVDALVFRPRRLKVTPLGEKTEEPKLVEYARSFFPILLIVCILRSFIVEPFRIPSGSMKPTLLEGDFILVNKFTYGVRLPLFGTKIISVGSPKRGDILVFRFPEDPSVDYIKRVIGIPGDKISYKDKVVYLNGKPLEQEYLGMSTDVQDRRNVYEVKQLREMLPSKPHLIYDTVNRAAENMDEITVPPGKYFAMGDNRDNSLDSRSWGFVPENLILGKAFFIWMSWDSASKDIRWHRMGKLIKD